MKKKTPMSKSEMYISKHSLLDTQQNVQVVVEFPRARLSSPVFWAPIPNLAWAQDYDQPVYFLMYLG